MAANKVVFGNKVLIDLTGDTVTEEALLKGYTAHKADGTIITGTAFAGYPNEFVFLDNIEDSSGNPIKDSSGKTIQGQTIYRKARNSVLLDSTGDIIEDGFEQQIEVVKFVWVSFISRLFLHLNPLGTVNAGQFVSIYNIPLHATDPSEWVIVENTHEPLVDKETFEKAQERVKEISDAYFAKEFTKHPPNEKNLLKGKIVCGDCGKGMRLSPRTTKSYVYFCGTFSDGINPACSRHKIDQEDVNKAVFAQISNHMRCCIDALRVIRELNARSSGLKKYDVYEKAITRQRRELEKVNRKFSELYGDYSEHLINESEYLTLKQQYLLKSEALKKEIDNLLISQNLYSKNYKIDADWENLINKYLKCRKLNKELADAFVDKVQVFEGGRISVNLVYDDCLEELLQVKNKREGDLNE